jgi:hypothetical protein
MMAQHIAILLMFVLAWACLAVPVEAATSREVWDAFLKNPASHPNLPDVSYAGYEFGEKPFPQRGRVVADVRKEGARGDGKTDDTAAFLKAIALARKAGGGVVRVPRGSYLLSDVLRLDESGLILRGDDATTTTLLFTKSLTDILGQRRAGGSSQWSWMGGLIWIGPAGTWTPDGTLADDFDEYWRSSDEQVHARVSEPTSAGANRITVDDASKIKAGDTVLMIWTDPSDNGFVHQVAGHEAMKSASFGGLSGADWFWPVEVHAVEGNTLTLRQPLRVDARPEWNVRLADLGPHVRGVGVEQLTIKFPSHPVARHLQDVGFSGLYFQRSLHCYARDIIIENYDVGVGFSAAKNCTVSCLILRGQASHHGTATRNQSHDNLVENFTIENQPFHGINTEGMSSGNVWRNGELKFGTFDSHRGMSFDSVRTNIRIRASGRPGGGDNAGPFLGKRIVHWNIKQTGGSGEWTNSPVYMPMGALVGVQGVELFETQKPFAMPPGEKGCIVVDQGAVPAIVDLYTVQLEARLKRDRIRRR